MTWTLIASLLFLVGGLYNFFGPQPNSAEGTAGLAISAALAGIHFFTKKQEVKNAQFLSWLIENASPVQSGGVVYNGMLVNSETQITQYQAAMSFLIISIKSPSRFYFVGSEPTAGIAAAFSIISLVFGWWGIPWGPVYTIQVLASNLRGGVKQRIGDLAMALGRAQG